MSEESELKYLKLLSEKYPTIQEVCTEIINLQSILSLPKGTEHFISDIHGEYEAFNHILNNCSGVIKEKVDLLFGEELSAEERQNLCTLIYYPEEKIAIDKNKKRESSRWYRVTLRYLIRLAKLLSSKYTRSKVRKALPKDYSYIIDELLHAQDDDDNQFVYHEHIINTIIQLESGNDFIIALTSLIKHLAVDHLHIVGDIYDRGARADSIMDKLTEHHQVDIEWGNHDILWMGAASGSLVCIAAVIRNSLQYNNMEILESGYGISMRGLTLFAEHTYLDCADPLDAAYKAISIIQFKLSGEVVMRHPEYEMAASLMLDKINYENQTIKINENTYNLTDTFLPTVNPENPYLLTREEKRIMKGLRIAFLDSERLHRHIQFLYSKGSLYKIYNGNLIFHGCVPFESNGEFSCFEYKGNEYKGKAYFLFCDRMARSAYLGKDNQDALDFMWFLWSGAKSPLSGRSMKTFERMFIKDEEWNEPRNPYYDLYHKEEICIKILREFGLKKDAHIINGHTPVLVKKGERPVKANGRLIVIDGGFCKAYQKSTGIAGYTLIFNSHMLRIKSHAAFESVEKAIIENKDIESESDIFEIMKERVMVMNTDNGKIIQEKILDLKNLLKAYKQGIIVANI